MAPTFWPNYRRRAVRVEARGRTCLGPLLSKGAALNRLSTTLCLTLLFLTSPLRAETHKRVVAPPAQGSAAVEARFEPSAGGLQIRRCRAADCSDAPAAPKTLPIPIDRARVDWDRATLELVSIGEGKHLIHARAQDRDRKDLTFEALVSGHSDEPIFQGLTGYTSGEEGDRSGQVVRLYDRDEHTKSVVIADVREDTRICGQAMTPLVARGLDPKTMQLRGATIHRLDASERDGATKIVGAPRRQDAQEPLARVVVATGGSSNGAPALTDGKVNTVWSESRSGDGHGEFVTMRAPPEVPIHSFVVTVAPPNATTKGASAAPRSFFVATDQKLFHVTLPEDAWTSPGRAYDVPLPTPIKTSCVAIVLDEAYARGLASPEVSIAEIAALTKFDSDGATLDDVSKELSGPRADEAAAILRRSGDNGLAAVAKRWGSLDDRGRALAVDVAASAGSCDGAAMDLLTRALVDKDREVKRRALGRISRCGKASTTALVAALRDERNRASVAPLLASIAPAAALEPLAEQLGEGSNESRHAIRGAFARAAANAPRDRLLAMLQKTAGRARLDMLRALGPKIAELAPESGAALVEIVRAAPDMPTRWLVAEPLAEAARARGAAEIAQLDALIRRDPDWPVRARAIEVSASLPAIHAAIAHAATDPEPRVREAAQKALGAASAPDSVHVMIKALATDDWTFVRVAAAESLGKSAESGGAASGLARALRDKSARVRAAAVTSLGALRATGQADEVRARLDDDKEDAEVRALAARALGAMCARSAVERLTKLALRSRAPVDETDERLGGAAIEALIAIHPPDLDKRLEPLRARDVRLPVRRAAERARSEPGICGPAP